MPPLSTPQDVIQAFGVAGLPGYFDVTPYIDAAGFSAKRPYPAGSPPALVIAGNGAPFNTCLIRIVVEPPKTPNGVSRVDGGAELYARCQERHRFGRHNFGDPDCPTQATFYQFRSAPRPQHVELTAEFFYDCADGRFYGPQGQLTGQQILNLLYNAHCATLGRRARVKAWSSRVWRNTVRWLVWRGQDICLWLLEHGYDIKPKEDKGSPLGAPFRRYKWTDFVRSSDEKGTHFFGFQSSKRSLFSNLIVLVFIVAIVYWLLPHAGILRAVYRNTPLSTAFLVFAFLMVDQLVPRLLQGIVWGLCRLRLKDLFF